MSVSISSKQSWLSRTKKK